MYLLLISRALSYAGVKTAGAVYSNYNQKVIEDISSLISLFDFIDGMQELTSLGMCGLCAATTTYGRMTRKSMIC